jgi:hypothetical protein
VKEAVAKACNCASSGLAFTAVGLIFMLLWASGGQAVPASVENRLSSKYQHEDLKLRQTTGSNKSFLNELDCLSSRNIRLCKYFDDINRMKHRANETTLKSSKNLHERQVRSLERGNKFTKNKFSSNDKNTFASYDDTKKNYVDFIRNISLDERVHKVNNGESVSMENVNETTLATYKASDVKANVQKETYLHVNGE